MANPVESAFDNTTEGILDDRYATGPYRAPSFKWWPHDHERRMFMHRRECCPACRLMQIEGGRVIASNLHVVVSTERLIVTEADDLHRPGRVLSGLKIASFTRGAVFRLTAELPSEGDPNRHLLVVGIATLTWGHRIGRLQVAGTVKGMSSCHEKIIDAVEKRLR